MVKYHLIPNGKSSNRIQTQIDTNKTFYFINGGLINFSFAVNLQLGPSVNPRSDIALHLSPVFNPPPRVVRNSLAYLEWGAEESHGGFPFAPGQPFEIVILVQPDMYKIAINGMHFGEFRHRVSPSQVNHLAIDGDVTIQGIIFENHNPSASMSAPPPHSAAPPPYPNAGAGVGMPPYPMTSGSVPYPPTSYPPPGAGHSYPTAGASSAYPPPHPSGSGYAPHVSGAGYPQQPAGYPQQASGYPYPTQTPYVQGYPSMGMYPGPSTSYANQDKGYLAGLGSGLFGSKSKKSGITPGGIAGIAAGVGAAAIGASVLSHAVPVRVYF